MGGTLLRDLRPGRKDIQPDMHKSSQDGPGTSVHWEPNKNGGMLYRVPRYSCREIEGRRKMQTQMESLMCSLSIHSKLTEAGLLGTLACAQQPVAM